MPSGATYTALGDKRGLEKAISMREGAACVVAGALLQPDSTNGSKPISVTADCVVRLTYGFIQIGLTAHRNDQYMLSGPPQCDIDEILMNSRFPDQLRMESYREQTSLPSKHHFPIESG